MTDHWTSALLFFKFFLNS